MSGNRPFRIVHFGRQSVRIVRAGGHRQRTILGAPIQVSLGFTTLRPTLQKVRMTSRRSRKRWRSGSANEDIRGVAQSLSKSDPERFAANVQGYGVSFTMIYVLPVTRLRRWKTEGQSRGQSSALLPRPICTPCLRRGAAPVSPQQLKGIDADTLSARPSPSNSLIRVARRSEPCTWADYRPVTSILKLPPSAPALSGLSHRVPG